MLWHWEVKCNCILTDVANVNQLHTYTRQHHCLLSQKHLTAQTTCRSERGASGPKIPDPEIGCGHSSTHWSYFRSGGNVPRLGTRGGWGRDKTPPPPLTRLQSDVREVRECFCLPHSTQTAGAAWDSIPVGTRIPGYRGAVDTERGCFHSSPTTNNFSKVSYPFLIKKGIPLVRNFRL